MDMHLPSNPAIIHSSVSLQSDVEWHFCPIFPEGEIALKFSSVVPK